MTADDIETQRVAGDIILALRTGTAEERESLLRVIARCTSQANADRWRRAYCPEEEQEV